MIFLLIVSTVAGDIGGGLQMPRLLTILFSPFFLVRFRPGALYLRKTFWGIFIFLFYCVLSLLWTVNITEGIKELAYYSVHFFMFFEIITFTKHAAKPMQTICFSVAILVILSGSIAFWELFTDNHLKYSSMGTDRVLRTADGTLRRRYAAVTFVNLNTYVTYLCFFIPFLFYGFLANKNKLLYISCLIATISIILFNASRGGTLTILVMFLIFFMLSYKVKKTYLYISILFIVLSFGYIVFGDEVLLIIKARTQSNNMLNGGTRYVIWENAFEVFKSYYGFGCGIGGLYDSMFEMNKYIVCATHNLFIEIITTFGILAITLFIKMLYKLLMQGHNSDIRARKICIYQSILTMPIYGIINSTYVLMPSLYTLLGLLFVFAHFDSIKPSQYH